MEALALLVVTLIASRFKVKLPGVTGSMSVNLPFILLAAGRLSMVEAVVIGCLAGMVQSYPSKSGFQVSKVLFNTANLAVTLVLTCAAIAKVSGNPAMTGLSLMFAGLVYMVCNTLPVAGVIKVTEGTSFTSVWFSILQMTFPYFALSATLATVEFGMSDRLAWELAAAMLDLLASEYGLGLKLRPLAYVPADVLLFGIEAAASAAWLARYRYGPLEWLWRTVTHARAQPLRRPAGAARP